MKEAIIAIDGRRPRRRILYLSIHKTEKRRDRNKEEVGNNNKVGNTRKYGK